MTRKMSQQADAMREYQESKMEGINWLYGPPSDILRGCLATSTHADIKLIGAWMAYWWGRERAERYNVRPSRGRTYIIDCPEKIKVRVVNPVDHRGGRNPFVNQVSFFRCIGPQMDEKGNIGRNPFVNQVSFF